MVVQLSDQEDVEDVVAWKFEMGGDFSIKSAYEFKKKQYFLVGDGIYIYIRGLHFESLSCHETEIFAWHYFSNGLPTMNNLLKRGWQVDSKCLFCDQ